MHPVYKLTFLGLSLSLVACQGGQQAQQRSATPDYQHFIGAMHEHSGYSDGEIGTTPADYYAAGKALGLDFMAGSEHSDNANLPLTANTDCLSRNSSNASTRRPKA